MYKLEYKAKIDDNCNKNNYISWFELFFPAQKYIIDIRSERRHHLIQAFIYKSLTKNLKYNKLFNYNSKEDNKIMTYFYI